MKKCKTCQKTKSLGSFTRRKERTGQYTVDCKICRAEKAKKYREKNKKKVKSYEAQYRKNNKEERNRKNKLRLRRLRASNPEYDKSYKLKWNYGITLDEWNVLFKKQDKSCAICKSKTSGARGFSTDHCHKTGKVRGILCHSCNTSLGGFKDDINILEAAINYLKNSLCQ